MLESKAGLEAIRSKYIFLLCEVCQQVKADAIEEVIGTAIQGIFDLERLYMEAMRVLGGEKVDMSVPSIAIILRTASEQKSLTEVCQDIVAEHRALWSLLDYVNCAIDAIKKITYSQYMKANSEAELVLVPAPEWPNVTLLKETYRHTPSIP